MSEKRVINNWIKTYLIGAMSQTKADDGGAFWRQKLTEQLSLRIDENNNPIFIFNPCIQEQSKVGLNPKEFHKKVKGWLSSGNNDKVAEGSDLIWHGKTYIEEDENGIVHLIKLPGDYDYVENSDFLICKIDEGDRPCFAKGTKVLMQDWSQKNIEDIKENDRILGFKKLKNKTVLVNSIVLKSQKTGYRKCIKVSDNKNNKVFVTPEHKFLTRNKKQGSIYKSVKEIDNCFSLPLHFNDITFFKGWITGYLQNDGHFREDWRTHQIIIVTDKYDEILIVKKILNMFKIKPTIIKKINKESKNINYFLSINKRKDFFELSDWKRNHPISYNFKRGWLTGAIDADGYFDKWSIRYSQSKIHKQNRDIFKKYCRDLNIHFNITFRKRNNMKIFNRLINNSGEYVFNISKKYAFLIPTQLPYKRKNYTLSIDILNSKIKKINASRQEIYDLTTTTGNFIANGFIVHNCGTFFEAGYAMKLHKPIYVLQTMPRENYSESFVGWVFGSGGKFFENESQLLEFLDKTYKLKVKK